MSSHLNRGIVIITNRNKEDMAKLDDYFTSSYAFEEWAIDEESDLTEQEKIPTLGPNGECIGIVRVFYAYDVPYHINWLETTARNKFGDHVDVVVRQEEVSEKEYKKLKTDYDFESNYREAL